MTEAQRERIKHLEQLAYCEIGLTWKSVALDRLKVIEKKVAQYRVLEEAARAVVGDIQSDCPCDSCQAKKRLAEVLGPNLVL